MKSDFASAATRVHDVERTCRNTRTLTVSTVHREWDAGCRRRHSYAPALRLNGEWLRRAGFAPGQKVRLTVGVGTIIIAVLDLTS